MSLQGSENKSHHHSIGGGAVYASGSTSSNGGHSHSIYTTGKMNGYTYCFIGGSDKDDGWRGFTSSEGAHTHSVGVNVPDHSHTCDYRGTDEARPNNYTYIIWKRIN